MRHSPKRKSPPIDSASIESSLRLNGSSSTINEPSIRLVTEDTNGLENEDTAMSSQRYQNSADELSEQMTRQRSIISRESSPDSQLEGGYTTPEIRSIPPANSNITNLANLNLSIASLPRQSSEVTAIGQVTGNTLSYHKSPSLSDNSMSANITQSESYDEKGLPIQPGHLPNKSPLRSAKSRRKRYIIGAAILAAIIIIVLAVALPVTVKFELYITR